MPKTDELIEDYKKKKDEISKRAEEFKNILNQSDERVFAELAFCICTPQSRAIICWKTISALIDNNLLFTGTERQIRPFMNAVRFADNKSKYIIEAREKFTENDNLKMKEKILSFQNAYQLRDWLLKDVKGLGMKEASHFIRNIGFDYSNQLAILDRHIIKNLKELEVIDEIPKTLTNKVYMQIEKKMNEFANKLNISMYELDMILWSKETGMIFK